ncbi:hypothetical protein LCM02_04885 [Lutimonas saemankumensis]|uniref:hypothetical protein n=1 Tax=Lutimonas saemankumensis TaxID=483016 RepID=UPI001CD391F6|nr:hypothetical protein [Lutimonas saemankumensis]MCA0931777.1 hypothetical protein [Lutimonas saemankumensis]
MISETRIWKKAKKAKNKNTFKKEEPFLVLVFASDLIGKVQEAVFEQSGLDCVGASK